MNKLLLNNILNNKKKRQNRRNNVVLPNNSFINKTEYNCVIPQNIFQTWHTKLLPPLMFKAVEQIKKNNPRFYYKLYDDNDCREFINKYFRPDVLNAYDRLIPGAYKADLWRYCVLFIHGGIYLDIKYAPYKGFKFINLCESEHYVLDADDAGIYNALMVSLPGNQILYKAIRRIVENVQNKYYGNCCLCPTGPKLLTNFISTNDPLVDLKHSLIDVNNKFIYYQNIPVLKSYNGHDMEKSYASKIKYYGELWNQRNIYI
uniref:Glycosyltransferase n=1 Tax=viral metagenome TaxID=1070528 RepID=A0A6C0JHJ0_9ZZZZ